jgi:glycosyltransferase involved in cell wall biosynthesis
MSEGGFKLQVSIEELQKRKLFLAVPMYGGQCAGMFTRSVSDLSAICTKHGIPLQLFFLFNESLVTRARNYCVDEFMRSGATHLMFIDSDIGFNPQDVIALLAMQNDESEYDVIGGPYPKKCISWEKIKQAVDKGMADEDPNKLEKYVGDYVFNPKTTQREIPLNQPVEVLEIGTGFMMIRRKTFEDYQKSFPHLWYKPDHVRTEHFDGTREIMAYFDCVIDRGYGHEDMFKLLDDVAAGGDSTELQARAKQMREVEKVASKRYLSEDYMFCYNVQKMGAKVFLCPWMQLQHVGSYIFGGSLADLASIGASATADQSQLKHKNKNK